MAGRREGWKGWAESDGGEKKRVDSSVRGQLGARTSHAVGLRGGWSEREEVRKWGVPLTLGVWGVHVTPPSHIGCTKCLSAVVLLQ